MVIAHFVGRLRFSAFLSSPGKVWLSLSANPLVGERLQPLLEASRECGDLQSLRSSFKAVFSLL